MLHLGIAGQTNLTDKWTDERKNNLYDLIEVIDKEQLMYLDGVVITMEKTEQLSQVIDWIIACRINPAVFIWVFSEVPLETEKKIMMSIGATNVIAMPETVTYLLMSIENTFVRLGNKYKEKSKKERETSRVIQLNETNQSLIVNEVEKELTRNEYKVLSVLYEKPNTTVLYSTLAKSLWPEKEFNISRIANIVCHIRNKIGKNDICSIETIRSRGYMFRLNNS